MTDPVEMPRSRLFWILQVAGWSAFGSAMWLAGLTHWQAGYTTVNKLALVALGFLLTVGLRHLYRLIANRFSDMLPILLSAGISSVLGSLLWVVLHRVAMTFWVSVRSTLPASSILAWPDFTTVLYQSFVLMAWSVLYFGINAHLDLYSEKERSIRAEATAHEARLRALRFQLQPHFLFNTLNAISTLVAEKQNTEANRMIGRLSEFLRMTLDRPDSNEIALTEEIDFLERYLEIEKIRFGERLHVGMDIDPGSADAMVPAMILQPIVENAVRHGILRREEGGTIRISTCRNDGHVTLTVHDDGPGRTDSGGSGWGIGLSNTRARLQEMYGGNASLVLEENGPGVRVAMRIPYRCADSGARS